MPKLLTPKDLARILCAVDEVTLFAALELRQLTCPTTFETLKFYFDLIQTLLDFVPMGKLLGKLAQRLIRGAIILIEGMQKGVPSRKLFRRVTRLLITGRR